MAEADPLMEHAGRPVAQAILERWHPHPVLVSAHRALHLIPQRLLRSLGRL